MRYGFDTTGFEVDEDPHTVSVRCQGCGAGLVFTASADPTEIEAMLAQHREEAA